MSCASQCSVVLSQVGLCCVSLAFLSHGGRSQIQASGTNPIIQVLGLGRH